MNSSSTILLISILLLTGCANPTDISRLYVGAEAGPVDITVAVDNNGIVSVSGGVAPKFKVGLGPVELKVGIQKTLELTKEKPFTLFVIWEDERGEIQREEYEIGKAFHVKFTQNELIQEIQGDNQSVIVVVKRPKDVIVVVTSTPTQIARAEPTLIGAENLEPQFDPNNPEGFLRWYFHEIWASRDYDNLWGYLSDDFRERLNQSYSSYVENWDAIGSIEEPIDI